MINNLFCCFLYLIFCCLAQTPAPTEALTSFPTPPPTSNKTTGVAGDVTIYVLTGVSLGSCLLIFLVALVLIIRFLVQGPQEEVEKY
jgi:hypothetical protein